ncbi:MAG: BlaI/MecI/CopY family transcriptional regulator [Longimicrobiales bacterium]
MARHERDGRSETKHALTGLQLALVRVLWERGSATVVEVQEALREERPLAQTTVATLLSRLEKRGVVAYRTEGRQYVYRALITEDEVRGSVLEEVTERLFHGDVATLVSHLISGTEVDARELARVRELIEARERELKRRKR